MDQQQQTTSDQDLSIVVSQLPSHIQEFFASGRIDAIARDLTQKYRLHIDQGTIMEREIIMLLLGLRSPDEFTKALGEDAKLDERTVSNIVTDVNGRIFIPLREQMRKESVETPPTPRPMTQVAPPSPRPISQIPARPSVGPSLRDVLSAVTDVPKTVGSEKLLEDHEEPRIEFRKTPTQTFAPMPQAPRIAPPPVYAPRPSPVVPRVESPVRNFPPPANLPGALPTRDDSPLPPIPRPYASDPYREPLE